MIPNRDYTLMSDAEIKSADTSKWIAVLPLGAHEQHGPHLPFDTDTIIAKGMACSLAAGVSEEFPITFLPTETVGYSIEHMDFEGSKTLGFDEAVNRWVGIGEKLALQGIRKMLILNAHGGNSPLMTIVATELRVKFNMFCVATSWTRFVVPGDVISHEEKAYGIHGGDIETSVVLALTPQAVDMGKADNFPNFQETLSEQNKYLRAYGPHAFGWKSQDLNPQGVNGNAAAATSAKGEALIIQATTGLVELVEEMHRFDASILD
jgi:creatinine amidohydrolase